MELPQTFGFNKTFGNIAVPILGAISLLIVGVHFSRGIDWLGLSSITIGGAVVGAAYYVLPTSSWAESIEWNDQRQSPVQVVSRSQLNGYLWLWHLHRSLGVALRIVGEHLYYSLTSVPAQEICMKPSASRRNSGFVKVAAPLDGQRSKRENPFLLSTIKKS